MVDRAGRLLVSERPNTAAYEEALGLVNEWRACHAYPLNTFNATLRVKAKKIRGSLIAQRLKRLPTIVDKLGRYPKMNLSQMQDIGGIRAVVNTINDVERLQTEYKDSKRFTHKLKREHDYILDPKGDGYRGVHLVFEYNNTLGRNGQAENYKGLNVEMQIRTYLQHTWATAVETTGTLIGDSFKTGAGSEDWREFFTLVSSAFAIVEGTPPVGRHRDLAPGDTYLKIARLEKELRVVERIKGYSTAANYIHRDKSSGYYNIIMLNTKRHTLGIASFTKNELKRATQFYAQLEARAEEGSDQVLVRAGDLKSLKRAYPNYFLDIRDFLEKLEAIIQVTKE